MNTHTPPASALSASARNLQRLCLIRSIAWSGEIIAIASAFWGLQLELQHNSLIMVLLISLLVIMGTLLRLRYTWPVTDAEFFLHLLTDVLLLWVLMYCSGGATNPFVSYFLIPLTVSAATLPWRHTCAIMATTLAAYTLLLFYYHPVDLLAPTHHHAHEGFLFNWHILGMWVNFVVSAALITFLITQMARSLRQQDKVLQTAREREIRNEHVIGIATMAANTAHAMGTPLSTIAVLLNEMQRSHRDNPQQQQDIDIMQQQITVCKTSLRTLMQTTERLQTAQYTRIPADTFFLDLLEQWRNMRLSARYSFTQLQNTSAPQIVNAPMLTQAIQNLLDNAADASPTQLDISLDWDSTSLIFRIRDYGAGIPLESADRLGKPFFSTKSGGLGLGLFLSHATLDLFAGSVRLFNQAGGGTLTEVTLPTGGGDD